MLKYGTALGRSVDLTRFDGYDDLISELDLMFDFKGSLKNGSSGWQISYMDYEGDMMLIGDYEWRLSITRINVFGSKHYVLCCQELGLTFHFWYFGILQGILLCG